MKNKFLNAGIFMLWVLISFTACKKDKPVPPPTSSTAPSRNDLTKDSIFLYAKEIYLWNTDLPSLTTFSPRSYNSSSDNYSNLTSELFAITRYSINPSTNLSYEYNKDYPSETKYSFIDDLVASGKLTFAPNAKSSVGLDGKGNDFGVALAAVGTSTNYKIYFKFTSPGSPAALAGLGRADIIESINGKSIGTDFNNEVDFINNAFDDTKNTTVQIAGKRKDNTAYNVTLTKKSYNSSPIYKDTVLISSGKQIGYLAFARFSDDNNSSSALDTVFAHFVKAGVTDLIIDLRYNGGGFVSTAEHLINLIAPSSANGKVMFSEAYNSTMQSGQATILQNQPLRDQSGKIQYSNGRMLTYADISYTIADNTFNINKTNGISNVGKVVFIISGSTASASELVINSLRPYVDVKTVGETSYGKPVGFFPVRIDKFDVYMSNFSSTNASGNGDYYAGFTPDSQKPDDVTKDFGNSNELCTAAALAYIGTGVFPSSTSNIKVEGVLSQSGVSIRNVFTPSLFNGMIDNTPKKLKKLK
ncbi:MAG: hypothetical protein IE931_09470 [Sphingobacteriales bacterium]|nr:hypothetical protein [Sphingobacteriales bacterium]